MHPMKRAAADGHNAKLRAMTSDYQAGTASNPTRNRPSPQAWAKTEGPEDASGFGADLGTPKSRGDRLARGGRAGGKMCKPSDGSPTGNRKHGGRVKHRADGGPTGSDQQATNQADTSGINNLLANQGLKAAGRARGGRSPKHKGTHVNVIVAPQGGGGVQTPSPPIPPLGGPPGGPPTVSPLGATPPIPPRPPMGGALPMAPGAPGGMPPGIIPPRARGGSVQHYGSHSGMGRLEKIGKSPERIKPKAV